MAVLSISSAALAQTTMTTVDCDRTAPCSMDIKAMLVGVNQEGIALTVPNQISFSLVPGALVPGNQPLTAVTNWYLDASYSNIWVDAYFKDAANAMVAIADSGPATAMGGNIPAYAIMAQQNGHGGTAAFTSPSAILSGADPLLGENLAQAAFPIKNIVLSSTTTTTDPSGTNIYAGQDTSYLNLWIDFRPTSPIYGVLYPSIGGTWQGVVYVRAQAY
ncbi:MAG: hypothetical protein FWD64_07475 [Acidobacteriaceae bacterium]|nr:hypothetical protein [Acidobacteriaceae bacterium]